MNEKALRVLEYHKITDQLAQHATTPMGREACLALVPMDSLESIKKAQKETDDALKRILSRGSAAEQRGSSCSRQSPVLRLPRSSGRRI